MRVDHPGEHQHPPGIDDSRCVSHILCPAQLDDLPILDAYVNPTLTRLKDHLSSFNT